MNVVEFLGWIQFGMDMVSFVGGVVLIVLDVLDRRPPERPESPRNLLTDLSVCCSKEKRGNWDGRIEQELSDFEKKVVAYFVEQLVTLARFAPPETRDDAPITDEQLRADATKRVLRRLTAYTKEYERLFDKSIANSGDERAR